MGAGGEGHAGVPVCPGSVAGPRAGVVVACGRGSLRVELGACPVPGALPGRAEVVFGGRAAKDMERREESRPGPGMVGGELQVRLPECVPEPRTGSTGLRQVEEGRAEGQKARVPPAEEEGEVSGLLPAHRRHLLLGERGDASPPRHPEDLRADHQARPQDRGRHRSHPVGHGVADGSAVVRVVHRGSRAGCAESPREARFCDRGRPRGQDHADRGGRPGATDRDRRPEVAAGACGGCAARPARTPGNGRGRQAFARAPRGLPASTPASAASARTRCARRPPRWRPGTRPSSWRT